MLYPQIHVEETCSAEDPPSYWEGMDSSDGSARTGPEPLNKWKT